MTRNEILKEHLDVIHVVEQLNTAGLKSKAPEIAKAADSGNILQINKALEKAPSLDLDQLKTTARKKFPAHMKDSEKHVNVKMKKAPQRIKDIATVSRAALLQIKASTNDPDIQENISDRLAALDLVMKKLSSRDIAGTGVGLILWAAFVAFFIGTMGSIAPLLALSGVAAIAAGMLIGLAKIVVSSYVEAKKRGARTVE